MENKKPILEMQNIFLLILRLALPSLASNLIMALYYIIDMRFIGLLGKEALSAISITYPVNIFVFSIGIGTGIGVSALLADLLGKKDTKEASYLAGNALILAFGYAILVLLAGLFFSKQIINIIGSGSPEVKELARQYLKIVLLGSPGIFLPMMASDILKGEGRTLAPMAILFFGAVMNTILDYVLIFGYGIIPAMGIKGAALATSLSRVISGVFVFILLFRKKNIIRPDFHSFGKLTKSIGKIYYHGISSILATIITAIVIFFVNWVVGRHDPEAIAFTAVMATTADAIVFLPVYGLAQGFIPLASYCYGAGDKIRLERVLKYTISLAFVMSFVGAIIFIMLPKAILMTFTEDQGLLNLGIRAFRIVGLSYIFVGPTIIMAAAFQSIGKSLIIALAALMRSIVILIPLLFILGELMGIKKLWWAFPITESISFLVVLLLIRANKKNFIP